jgi:hypothetical protein
MIIKNKNLDKITFVLNFFDETNFDFQYSSFDKTEILNLYLEQAKLLKEELIDFLPISELKKSIVIKLIDHLTSSFTDYVNKSAVDDKEKYKYLGTVDATIRALKVLSGNNLYQKQLNEESELNEIKEFEKSTELVKIFNNLITSEIKEIVETIEPLPEEDKNVGITKDLKEYLETVAMMSDHRALSSMLKHQQIIFDYEVIKNADLYALSPVCMYNGKGKTMDSNKFDTMEDLRNYLNGRKYALYYTALCVKTYVFDETFKRKYLDNPEFSFLFRGFFID